MEGKILGADRKANALKFREFRPDLAMRALDPNIRCFLATNERGENMTVFISQHRDSGWHLSIAHPDRLPTWDEVAEARYRLLPDRVTMGMLLPPRQQYVNLHEYCFHLHQVPDNMTMKDIEAGQIIGAGSK